MNILVAGDSFAAEWPGELGWPKLLAKKHNVTNIAQAGVSEYKIYKQLVKQDFKNYDAVIVSHTSPSRVHIKEHPLHKTGLHKDCDLIYNDIVSRNSFFNPALQASKDYFRYIYDEEYYTDMYTILREKINSFVNIPYLSIGHLEITKYYIVEEKHIDFSEFWQKHKGKENHYSPYGNEKVYKIIIDNLKKLV